MIVGVDEVGCGSIAGPVIAAAVVMNNKYIPGLTDSKLLSSKKRENLVKIILKNCTTWAIGYASVKEIEVINILQASLLAMKRAINTISILTTPQYVLVDGKYIPDVNYSTYAIIKGDVLIPEISAASIIAKVMRDKIMIAYHNIYPEYKFDVHKGYGTYQHCVLIKKYGISPIHRCSFKPVKNILLNN